MTIGPGESVIRFLDSDLNDDTVAWIPSEADTVLLYAGHDLAIDENPTNDISPIDTIIVLPSGIYEYGYDNRLAEWTTTRFRIGEIPCFRYFSFGPLSTLPESKNQPLASISYAT